MRSIWKGAISFGLVTIPVKLYSATEQRDVSFHQVHREDGGRIKYKRVCSIDGEEVQYSDIAKGYELSSGEVVVLTDDDFADLPLSTSRTIDVLEFVPAEQIDPIYFAKSYYLEPESAGAKPYVLLREALSDVSQVALVKVALRQRETLATLRVRDGVFVLEMMLWPDEIRTPEFGFLDEDIDVRPQELAMARSLIESMAGDFDPSQYSDDYREALQALIEAKVEGREVVTPDQPAEQAGTVVDLMAALRASVEAAKAGRAGGSTEAAADAEEQEAAEAGEAAGGRRPAKRTAKAAVKSAAKSADRPAKSAKPSKAASSGGGKTAKPAKSSKTAKSAGGGRTAKKAAKQPARKTAARKSA